MIVGADGYPFFVTRFDDPRQGFAVHAIRDMVR